MSKPSATLNNKYASLKKGFRTYGGVYQKLKKGYITKNGIWQRCYNNGLEFTYKKPNSQEDALCEQVFNENTGQWTIAFLETGILTFLSLPENRIDLFLGGKGYSGTGAYDTDGNTVTVGGNGGRGGFIRTEKNIEVSERVGYTVSVSGTGGVSSVFSSISNSDLAFEKSNTGDDSYRTGGASAQRFSNAGGGLNGFKPFGDGNCELYSDRLFGASGGGAGAFDRNYESFTSRKGAAGGDYGAGRGYDGSNGTVPRGENAEPNSCSGGGGNSGSGGSGIILMRSAR